MSAAVVDSEQGILLLNGDGEKNDAIVGATSIPVEVDAWGNLSPDGKLASVEHDDEGFIVDAATGEKQPFNHGHEWALAFDWINDTHIATMVFDGIDDQQSMVGSLVDCDTTAGTCETVLDELPAIGSFQLPIGLHLGGE